MRITAGNNVVIECDGCSDCYDGAMVQGAFSGRKYYALDDVVDATGLSKAQIEDMDGNDPCPMATWPATTISQMIEHHCKAVRTTGCIIQ